jgi:hypothetical protein
MKSKKIIIIVCCLFLLKSAFAQSFNTNKTSLAKFIKRMYNAIAFEGVKVVDDYDHQYLVSVISIEKAKYTNESIMNRVAQVKAQSQASTLLNGSSISMDILITTKETVEQIKQNSMGFILSLELLTNFDNSDNNKSVFVYSKEIK